MSSVAAYTAVLSKDSFIWNRAAHEHHAQTCSWCCRKDAAKQRVTFEKKKIMDNISNQNDHLTSC
jgi:hypothetical protein